MKKTLVEMDILHSWQPYYLILRYLLSQVWITNYDQRIKNTFCELLRDSKCIH